MESSYAALLRWLSVHHRVCRSTTFISHSGAFCTDFVASSSYRTYQSYCEAAEPEWKLSEVLHAFAKLGFLQGFGSGSVSGSAWIRINLSCWIRIRIRIQIADPDPDPGGQKLPKKIEKRTEFSSFEVLDVLFWELKASSVAWESFMEA